MLYDHTGFYGGAPEEVERNEEYDASLSNTEEESPLLKSSKPSTLEETSKY